MMTVQIPNIIFETDGSLSSEAIARVRKAWLNYCEQVRLGQPAALVLDGGLRARVIASVPVIPDAFCRYCGVANLNTSVWCQACGAPLLREP